MSSEKQTHYDHDEVVRSDGGRGVEFGDVVSRRIDRRGFLKSGLVATIAASGVGKALGQAAGAPGAAEGLDFRPVTPSTANDLALASGYGYQIVLSWGARLDTGEPCDVAKLTASDQAASFGYNNDSVAYLPLPFGWDSSDHALLAVNHEYVNPELMFPIEEVTAIDRSQAEISMQAVGMTVAEIKREGGKWKLVPGGKYNKRYTATSPMRISDPAKGDARLKTKAHPDGTTAFLAIQHPDEGGKYGAFENSWPEPGKLSRPSIVAIQAENGASIGSPEANPVTRRSVIAELLGR